MVTRDELLAWIGLPEAAEAVAAAHPPAEEVAALRARLLADTAPPAEADPMSVALAALDALDAMRDAHRRRGLSEEISQATAADLALWMREHHRRHGVWGLGEGGWLRHHLSGRLLRLGRLQFMPAHCELTDLRPDEPLQPGDAMLDVHIPAGEPLTAASCADAFARSAACFAATDWRGWFCHSWLLGPRLAEVLPAHSGILVFQRHFTLLSSAMDDRQAIERIFGTWPLDPGTAPRATSLQRAVLAFYAAGNRLHGGCGFRPR